jgi:undecaprenyl-diphosphatase
MGMQILYALETLRTPLLDAVLGALTELGNETLFMAAALILYWCVSKKYGYYVLFVGVFGTLINQFAKIMCRVPRPWVRDPGFTIVENARAEATGYSFPSGHTAGIMASGGCIARISKKAWVRAVCIVLIALVAFSRMYLGVHYPTDVLFSVVVGVVLVFAFYPFFAAADRKIAPVYWLVVILAVLSLAYALFVTLHRFPADTDADNLASAVKTGWTMVGTGLGMVASLHLERRYVNFDCKACWWAQLIKVVGGLALILAVRAGLKPVLAAVFGGAQFQHAIRYFCMVIVGAVLWPMTFRWFASLGKKR